MREPPSARRRSLLHVRRIVALAAFACLAARPQVAGAQAVVPHQMHRTATFELHSILDDVQLYEGDPQFLFRIDVRPENSLLPKIDFSNNNQVVVLRVHDLAAFEPAVLDSARLADNLALGIEEDVTPRSAVSQGWKIELAPAAPTDFILRCEGGKSVFDFTDLPVEAVHLLADTAVVRVEFNRPNPAVLERFKLTARVCKVDIRGFANSRSRSTTLQLFESNCEVDLGGKLVPGDTEIFFEGAPTQLRVVIPRRAGVRVEGPAATVGQFDRDGMAVVGNGLQDGDFGTRPSRLHLYFSQPVSKLDVRWKDAD
jgi:hypothetical protein